MADPFDDWLVETKGLLTEIRASVTEVRTTSATLLSRATDLRATATQLSQKGRALGARGGPWWNVAVPMREGVRRSMALTHSLELVVKPSYLLTGMGVNLDQLVPTQEFGTPPNIGTIAQDGPGRVLATNENDCHAIAPDQFGIEIPMQLTLLGTAPRFMLEVTLHPRPGAGPSEFAVRQSRFPDVCPPTSLPTPLRTYLVREAARHIEASLTGSFVPPFDLDMGLGRPQYYGSGFEDNLRIFGAWGRRPRGVLPFLGALPAWAHIGAKLSTAVLVDKLRALAARLGARIIAGPDFHADNRFEVVGEVSGSVGVKIGCIFFGADIAVRVRLNCSVRVVGGNVLVFRADPVGSPDVEIHTRPHLVPGLQHLIDAFLSEVAERFIPDFQIPPERYTLGMARRAEVDLDAQRLAIFLEMRR